MRTPILVLIFISQIWSITIWAKDFGKYGTTFKIKEEGFTTMIQRKLSNVDIEEHHKKMQKIAKERVALPKPVIRITKADRDREFYYDPTYVLFEDIVLPCGRVLYQAGTTVNPLDHLEFDRRLFFIDGRDEVQVKWLKEKLKIDKVKADSSEGHSNVQNRIILVGGKIFDLQDQIGEQLYFDQSGELTGKFGIKAVPAVVEQEGKKLKIKEVDIEV